MVLKSMYKYLIAILVSSILISVLLLYNVSTGSKLARDAKVIIKEPSPYITDIRSSRIESDEDSRPPPDGYVVHTPSCHIPDVQLWHHSILRYVQKNQSSLQCGATLIRPDLTFTKGDLLMVNDTNIPYYGDLDFCEYVEITRPPEGDSSYNLGHKRYVFRDRITLKKEFVKVYCYSKNNSMIYQNLHAFTPVKSAVKHLKESLFVKHKRYGYLENLDVMMVGIDSVSRLNFRRQFPQTYKILKDEMKAYEMFGYNKVRDNTFINLVPMFLGKYVEETGWNETSASTHTFDNYSYSWKKFGNAGYHTLFAEDAPNIAIWNFEKPGFTYAPADYYLRPFSIALEKTTRMWHNHNHCFGERLETDIVLDYVHKFIKTRQKSPYFAFTFLTRPTYDSINQNTDESHAKFLTSLLEENLLDNTLVIYFSDHGARRGDILSTYIGKLEERLPAMFISLPNWFRRKYPQIAGNLETNQHRLTTPFDINALLDDVLRFHGQPKQSVDKNSRSISLFDRVPTDRSCLTTSIDDHWCTCLQKAPVDVSDKKVVKAANAIVAFINKKTEPYREKCVEYKLENITDALSSTPNEKLLTHIASVNDVIGRKEYYGESAHGKILKYHVTLTVSPSSGVYQATVTYDSASSQYSVSKDISRTSLYGNASWCVTDHDMKKYCYCIEKFPME